MLLCRHLVLSGTLRTHLLQPSFSSPHRDPYVTSSGPSPKTSTGAESPWDSPLEVFKESAKQLGFWMALRYALIYALSYKPVDDTRYDDQHGTNTSGIVPTRNLDIAEDSTRWQANLFLASPARITRYMIEAQLSAAPIDPQDYSFVDYGSGKGRSTLVAAEYPFKRAIGIEISAELTAIARQNAEQIKSRCTAPIEFFCTDARKFLLPEGNLFLHMYHPFGQDILREVLSGIREQAIATEQPRRILIPYLFSVAMAKAVFHEFPEFRRTRDVFCMNPQYRWTLYEWAPHTTTSDGANKSTSLL